MYSAFGPNIHWSARERHDGDLNTSYRELGFMDPKGRMLSFDGARFWPLFNALGHDSTVVETCKCRTNIFRTE